MQYAHRLRICFLSLILALVCSQVLAVDLSGLAKDDAVGGLKDALNQGSDTAVAELSAPNGFLNNEKVRIALPDSLQRVQKGLRMLGMQKQVDELIVAMNRAAELAVPQAKALLLDALKKMSIRDAIGILTGGDTAATDYFQRTARSQLAVKFLPIVTEATRHVELAEKYNAIAAKGARLGLIDNSQAKIEVYVTEKALDGLFYMMAEQEKAIRKHPAAAVTGLAKRVFGLL